MDNKELILKSALDLFYAKGYDAVGVQEIVDKAGISKQLYITILEASWDFCRICWRQDIRSLKAG